MTKCIIIGNGPNAIEKENGDIIESFDKIIRINNFITTGYDKHVGSRTDILFTCEFPDINNNIPEVILSLVIQSSGDFRFKAENVIDNLDFDFAKMVGEKAEIEWPKYPSTGLLAIYYMLFIRNYDVTITGFDNFKGGRSAHYSDIHRQDFPTRHDGDKEKKYIEKLNLKCL